MEWATLDDAHVDIRLSNVELLIITNCVRETLDALSEGDFHSRTGGFVDEAEALRVSLRAALHALPHF